MKSPHCSQEFLLSDNKSEQVKDLHGCQRNSDFQCSDDVLPEAIQEVASQSAGGTAHCDASVDSAEVSC